MLFPLVAEPVVTANSNRSRLLHVSAQVLGTQIKGIDHLRILAGLEQVQSTTRFIRRLPREKHRKTGQKQSPRAVVTLPDLPRRQEKK